MYELKSSNYVKERKVLIDGIEATIRPIGARTQLVASQRERRRVLVEKRLQAGTDDFKQMEADVAELNKIEDEMLDQFNNLIRDGSPDNAKIKAWLDRTPLEVIQEAFTDMQKQFAETDGKAGDGQSSTTEAAA